HLVLAAMLAMAGSAAAAPSFNCAKASTPVEKAICTSTPLANLDAAMAQQYKAVREKLDAEAAKALTADQRYFLGVRDDIYAAPFTKGTSGKEIGIAMRSRLDFLKSINPQPPAGFVGKWKNVEGEIEITQAGNGQFSVSNNSFQPYYARWV